MTLPDVPAAAPRRRSLRGMWRWGLPPALLVLVAVTQPLLVHRAHLVPWKGGGFGMFAATDGAATRRVRLFVERELVPHEDEVEQLDQVTPELASAIRRKALDAGLYAANMPEDVGGGGLDAVVMPGTSSSRAGRARA